VLSALVIEEANVHIQTIDARQLPRFERFLADCQVELIADPTCEQVQQQRDLVRDASDIPIALAAMNAKVEYLVTYDRDFTDLDPTTAKVRQAIPGILLPPVFLREVMGWTSEQLEAIRYREWADLEER
jgi:predicted nucleic acid-binding protein